MCPVKDFQQLQQCNLQGYPQVNTQQFDQKEEAFVDQKLNVLAKDYGYKYANLQELTELMKSETFTKKTLPEKIADNIKKRGTTLKNFFETQAAALEKQEYK